MYRNPSGNARRISAKAAILATSLLFPVRMTSRVRATGLEYTMEHPASSRRVATVHWTVAFTWVRARRLYQNKEGARRLLFYFGAGIHNGFGLIGRNAQVLPIFVQKKHMERQASHNI